MGQNIQSYAVCVFLSFYVYVCVARASAHTGFGAEYLENGCTGATENAGVENAAPSSGGGKRGSDSLVYYQEM